MRVEKLFMENYWSVSDSYWIYSYRHYFSSFKIFNYRVWRVNLSIYETIKKKGERERKNEIYFAMYNILHEPFRHSLVTFQLHSMKRKILLYHCC